MNTVFRKGVELSNRLNGELSPLLVIPGLALAAVGLIYLGKKTGDYLKQKIGKVNTIELSMVGLLAGVLSAAAGMLFKSSSLILLTGLVVPFSVGMTMSTDNKVKNK